MNFGQVLTAMVTPFDQDGNVDFQATKELINHLLENGSDGIVVAGTTGETPTLSIQEKAELYRFAVETADGRAPVLAGTGTNSTRAAIELTRLATQAGVDGVMLATPYYNKPNQEGMYQHFKAIADSTHLPVMLYNVPGRSVVNLLPETVVRLSEISNIVSIKEASGDLDAMSEIIQNTPEDFTLYSGDDSLTLPILSIGGNGVVSVASHIIGNEMKAMVTAHQNGQPQYAASLHRELVPVMNAMFSAPSPAPVKAALEMSGVKVGSVRLPMVPLTPDESQKVYNAIRHKIFSSAV
ncbi:4-hydroxy-tetrahydrodipicolinate synthase [Salipaludibacillus aurantiacus]|uniref:4-hydroxy-tetrahydrodipicolinate synthase n=1 Tax=Salipaludibacillus aurantiacus TaxID=1601833 RepID=A0A1H9VTG5_9BACI|nr:4-hydroxy-tetrahydrodipicolinate synthase [Salipaludibacillus aurantiacus]SES25110.1 4-hydroxy-tetrahydrodipicolinate synthase [Salipaludibacillus aurantiacus]